MISMIFYGSIETETDRQSMRPCLRHISCIKLFENTAFHKIEQSLPFCYSNRPRFLLPSEHLMDAGYVDGEHIVNSKKQYDIELVGPVALNGTWQAKAANGFDISQFEIDWEHHMVTCPEGKTSRKWTPRKDFQDFEVIRAQFGKADCLACPFRSQCTRSATNPRQIIFRTQEQHEAIQTAR